MPVGVMEPIRLRSTSLGWIASRPQSRSPLARKFGLKCNLPAVTYMLHASTDKKKFKPTAMRVVRRVLLAGEACHNRRCSTTPVAVGSSTMERPVLSPMYGRCVRVV